MCNFDFFARFCRQDDAFNILELNVNHINLFINVRFINIIILQYYVQAKMYGVFVLIQ